MALRRSRFGTVEKDIRQQRRERFGAPVDPVRASRQQKFGIHSNESRNEQKQKFGIHSNENRNEWKKPNFRNGRNPFITPFNRQNIKRQGNSFHFRKSRHFN